MMQLPVKSKMAELLTFTSIVSLTVTAAYAAFGVVTGFYLGKKLSNIEKWILAWLVFDAWIHFTLVKHFDFPIMIIINLILSFFVFCSRLKTLS